MRDTLKENTKQFATAEEEVTYESSGPQVKPHQWVEPRTTNGKLHKLKSVLLIFELSGRSQGSLRSLCMWWL